MFCILTVPEGAEAEVAPNIYATRLESFNQLRTLLTRLLDRPAATV
jgi:hypothetical protein